jgi:N utilization substance protein B
MESGHFTVLVTIAEARAEDIDRLITASIEPEWTLLRLEPVLRSILRGACAEFLTDKGIPPAVIINEYVTIAHEFYGGKEPAFVNGILEAIAASLGFELRGRAPAARSKDLQS